MKPVPWCHTCAGAARARRAGVGGGEGNQVCSRTLRQQVPDTPVVVNLSFLRRRQWWYYRTGKHGIYIRLPAVERPQYNVANRESISICRTRI